ncbi:uncharacterized protein EV422DRAFT_616946 [Fimicolochytrium jonesii]|uniref:uncharacterized protein n=1 Tax=Fimicolochytrium jonesii TaxID=1396493 RepID=UPI0022FE514F|nr:uncharacterized protein EV422DRAFT_616946 [Fimicolochytrium jonesii]KAI8825918.1 hypothetical protein EV422DRAFT_616946 [Fimicolochytrium jonesii]
METQSARPKRDNNHLMKELVSSPLYLEISAAMTTPLRDSFAISDIMSSSSIMSAPSDFVSEPRSSMNVQMLNSLDRQRDAQKERDARFSETPSLERPGAGNRRSMRSAANKRSRSRTSSASVSSNHIGETGSHHGDILKDANLPLKEASKSANDLTNRGPYHQESATAIEAVSDTSMAVSLGAVSESGHSHEQQIPRHVVQMGAQAYKPSVAEITTPYRPTAVAADVQQRDSPSRQPPAVMQPPAVKQGTQQKPRRTEQEKGSNAGETFVALKGSSTGRRLSDYMSTLQRSTSKSFEAARAPIGSASAATDTVSAIPRNPMDILFPSHALAPIFSGYLYKLGRNKRWQWRLLRFDGQLLTCLSNKKGKFPMDSVSPTAPTYISGDNGDVIPLPHSPLLADSSRDFGEPRTGNQRVHVPKWTIHISSIASISLIKQTKNGRKYANASMPEVVPTTSPAVTDPEANPPKWYGTTRVFVIRTMEGRNYVLRAKRNEDLERWLFVLLGMWRLARHRNKTADEDAAALPRHRETDEGTGISGEFWKDTIGRVRRHIDFVEPPRQAAPEPSSASPRAPPATGSQMQNRTLDIMSESSSKGQQRAGRPKSLRVTIPAPPSVPPPSHLLKSTQPNDIFPTAQTTTENAMDPEFPHYIDAELDSPADPRTTIPLSPSFSDADLHSPSIIYTPLDAPKITVMSSSTPERRHGRTISELPPHLMNQLDELAMDLLKAQEAQRGLRVLERVTSSVAGPGAGYPLRKESREVATEAKGRRGGQVVRPPPTDVTEDRDSNIFAQARSNPHGSLDRFAERRSAVITHQPAPTRHQHTSYNVKRVDPTSTNLMPTPTPTNPPSPKSNRPSPPTRPTPTRAHTDTPRNATNYNGLTPAVVYHAWRSAVIASAEEFSHPQTTTPPVTAAKAAESGGEVDKEWVRSHKRTVSVGVVDVGGARRRLP